MTLFDPATRAQIDAMEPSCSTWLSANAGSGKTRVLTNRVALLLLAGTKPQNIVCLTYTKAAASEMQNRLFERLGDWAMLPDPELKAQLAELGVEVPLGTEQLASARTLFALAIETPGGLRIQTIHSFCASILRRFPLEAGISPLFRELDDRGKKDLQTSILRDMASGPDAPLLHNVSRISSGLDHTALLAAVSDLRDRFDLTVDHQDIRAWFGLSQTDDLKMRATEILSPATISILGKLQHALVETGQQSAADKAASIEKAIQQLQISPSLEPLFEIFLVHNTDGWKIGSRGIFPKPLLEKHPDLADQSRALAERLLDVRLAQNNEIAADNTWSLYLFARAFLKGYAEAKQVQGWLDFDDQIAKAEALLTNRAVCDWVMFRLDGGIDHILVDESQDTSPAQWRIIKLLAQDFGREQTGDRQRTIFVVGDKKQSIYSFQGADPDGFDLSRDHFMEQLSAVAQTLQDRTLRHSFRSAPAILEVVDKVFEGIQTGGFTGDPHLSFHRDMPGRVDIWHPLGNAERHKLPPWYDLSDPPESADSDRLLADHIADHIQHILSRCRITTAKGETRRIVPGDILILVQRRKELFHHIIRACKARQLPIAGADRLRISEELAVKDLRALLSFLALPQDSLSLATALRSPLFGWSEKELFNLAHYRKTEHLWDTLQINQELYPETYPILKHLRDRADFLAPYDLLDLILTRWGGRLRLVSRLGHEAEEGIDELLNLARDYEAGNPASLTGFLAWLERDDSDVKRQAEAAGTRIRVMTTHGAKGLESPIVILPETHTPGENHNVPIVTDAVGRPIWRQNGQFATEQQKEGAAAAREKSQEERLRLFYVALTRAENWLIICGAGDAVVKPGTWYQRALAAMTDLGAVQMSTHFGEGLRFERGNWPEDTFDDETPADAGKATLDHWCHTEITQPPRPRKLLKPSEMVGAKSLGGSDENPHAILKGTAVHLLLEHYSWSRQPDSTFAARALLDLNDIDLPDDELLDAIAQAQAVLSNPDLAWLFSDAVLAEIAVTAPVSFEGHDQMYGIIDRLVIEQGRVVIVDFKTNAIVPATPEETPTGILNQLGVYAQALSAIYPDKQIECAVVWTATCEFMPIPHNIVMRSLGSTAAS